MVNLNTGSVVHHTADAFFAFHEINSFVLPNGSVALDMMTNDMSSGQIPVAGLTIANMLNESIRDGLRIGTEMRRYILPPLSSTTGAGSAIRHSPSQAPQERRTVLWSSSH